MRFPLSLVLSMSRYIAGKKFSGQKRFPLVLMLEPSHRCNLRCQGCGRIREYQSTLSESMSVQECLEAVDECGAPTVSICGGEPLLYDGLEELLAGILRVPSRHVYLCTNGLLLEERLKTICPALTPRMKKRLFVNVHLDGPPCIHDMLANKPGLFHRAMSGLIAAKKQGLAVYTNTTVYRQTSIEMLIELAETLRAVPVNGIMISPAFGFESVDDSKERIFMSRDEIQLFFHEVRHRMKRYRLTATPIFFDFLEGRLNLDCAAWANPTRNVCGWRSPCYLIGDRHEASWNDLLEKTDWNAIGPGRDHRCDHCMTHCGFEPAAVLKPIGFFNFIRLAWWQLFS